MTRDRQLAKVAREQHALIERAQPIISAGLEPGRGQFKAFNRLVALFDGHDNAGSSGSSRRCAANEKTPAA